MCGNEFKDYFETSKFCSRACYNKHRIENGNTKAITCPVCNNLFRQKYSKQIFCSVECRIRFTEKKIECRCDYCGKLFTRIKSEVDKNTRHYCSKECKINAMTWCIEDVEILKNNFGKMRYKDMVNLFSKERCIDEIKRKAISLGLTSSRKWTDEEISILVDNYSQKPMSDILTMLPNRTVGSILGQARQQNLKSFFYVNHIYSKEDEEYLRDNYMLLSNEELGEKLNRTPSAIAQHLLVLNLHRPTEINNYDTIATYVRKRIYPWRNKFAKSKNYTCELTGVNKDVTVHHIRGFNLLLEEAMCDLNFPIYSQLAEYTQEQLDSLVKTFLLIQETYHSYICISEKIHKQFHSIYGYGNNTEQQWNNFINTYYE